jgi:hypothetical protein
MTGEEWVSGFLSTTETALGLLPGLCGQGDGLGPRWVWRRLRRQVDALTATVLGARLALRVRKPSAPPGPRPLWHVCWAPCPRARPCPSPTCTRRTSNPGWPV